jgi:hypothetical protein
MYGGTITSVLINTPGESASVMTTLDGYQMAVKGRAGAGPGGIDAAERPLIRSYFPCQFGVRFSRKARTPSWKSWLR